MLSASVLTRLHLSSTLVVVANSYSLARSPLRSRGRRIFQGCLSKTVWRKYLTRVSRTRSESVSQKRLIRSVSAELYYHCPPAGPPQVQAGGPHVGLLSANSRTVGFQSLGLAGTGPEPSHGTLQPWNLENPESACSCCRTRWSWSGGGVERRVCRSTPPLVCPLGGRWVEVPREGEAPTLHPFQCSAYPRPVFPEGRLCCLPGAAGGRVQRAAQQLQSQFVVSAANVA